MTMKALIGREQEVRHICSLLQSSTVRLLTLTGPGGVGKTRLGMQVMSEITADGTLFPDGGICVSLAPLREKDLVLPTLLRALGLKDEGQQAPLALLKKLLREKHMLLFLDNFEQVGEAAPLFSELLAHCPSLKLLITSREVLHLHDEYEFRVAPLALPDLKRLPDQDTLAQTAAVALFVQCAQTMVPQFTLNEENARAIAEICVRLDGLPLALELAAARMKLLSPQSLLARLSRRLTLLTGGKLDAPARQQTLRHTLEWSHQLLSAREQLLFRRLAIFVGGASLEAIEALWTALEGRVDAHLLDLITSLVDKSLLQVQSATEETDDPRFVMLETIREYALGQLEQSEGLERVQQEHALYYLEMAERVAPKLIGPEQVLYVRMLERDHDNQRAAMSWLLASCKTEEALRLCNALWMFMAQNHTQEGYRWIKQALALHNEQGTGAAVKKSVLAWGYYSATALGRYSGHMAQTTSDCRQSLVLFRQIDDQQGIAIALSGLGHLAMEANDYTTLQAVSEEALSLIRPTGNLWRLCEALFLCAYSAYFAGDYAKAYALAEECLGVCRAVREPVTTIRLLYALGLIAYAQKHYTTAQSHYEESIALARSSIIVGRNPAIAVCLLGLGCVVAAQEQSVWAARLWGAAHALYEHVTNGTIGDLGVYDYLATLLRTQLHYDAIIAAVRNTLGEREFQRAWQEGQAMSLDQVLVPPGQSTAVVPQERKERSTDNDRSADRKPLHESLTPREIEVLRLLAQGSTSAQIARHLSITVLTVNSHVRSIYSKLGITSRSAATRYALEQKLV